MSEDPYYSHCCMGRFTDHQCSGRIEYHHNLIYGSRQSNERFSILPLCHKHHMEADRKDRKEMLNWIMLNRAVDFQLIEVSKAVDYLGMRDRLNDKFGVYKC